MDKKKLTGIANVFCFYKKDHTFLTILNNLLGTTLGEVVNKC